MKQNNHGWSLKEMLFLSGVLLFFVLLVAFLVNHLYSGLSMDNQLETKNQALNYTQVENNLKQAGIRFYHQHKNEVNDLITSRLLLEKNYITQESLTVGTDVCEGYVLYQNQSFRSFIHCEHYQTEGY